MEVRQPKLEDKYLLGEDWETFARWNGLTTTVTMHYVDRKGGYNNSVASWVTLCGKRVLYVTGNGMYEDRAFYDKYQRCASCVNEAGKREELNSPPVT